MSAETPEEGKPIKDRQCITHKAPNLGYLAWLTYADKLHRKGIRQKQCPKCGYWFYPQEM